MKNIQELIKKWQDKLELQNWKIGFEIVDEFKRADDYPQTGDIKFDIKNKTTTILILKGAKKIEEIVVHELAHLVLLSWDLSIDQSAKTKKAREKHLGILENTAWILTKILLK